MWIILVVLALALLLALILRKPQDTFGGYLLSAVGALIFGLLGCVVLFAFGSATGRGEIGVAAAFFFCVWAGVVLLRKYPTSMWYGGAVISLPFWIFFKYVAEPGQFESFFWGLVAILAGAYGGTLIGLRMHKKKTVFSRTSKILLVAIPLVAIVVVAYILNLPHAVPPEKNSFVGLWKSSSGFELQIMPNGEARITQNVQDRGFEYEQLNIKVAPSQIQSANVEFMGDTTLFIIRHGYYSKEYKIDASPYADADKYKMVLNGVQLVKE